MFPLMITRQALEKAEKYAKLVYDEHKAECYGWLLTPRGARDVIVRDVMLANDQKVSRTHCTVSGEGVITSTTEALRNGYRIVGWWHSHANFEPFQSGIDQTNTERLREVLKFSVYTMKRDERKLLQGPLETIVNGDTLTIKEKEGGNALLITVNGQYLIDNGSKISDVRLVTSSKIGFCYSLTVNAKKHAPSVQIAVHCDDGKNIEEKLIDTTLEIADSDELLKKEVLEKLHHD